MDSGFDLRVERKELSDGIPDYLRTGAVSHNTVNVLFQNIRRLTRLTLLLLQRKAPLDKAALFNTRPSTSRKAVMAV